MVGPGQGITVLEYRPCDVCSRPTRNKYGVCGQKGNPECVREHRRRERAERQEEINRRRRELRAASRETARQCDRKYKATLRGKATGLRSGAHNRAKAGGLPFDLTTEWIEAALETAVSNGCPYLGIPIRLGVQGIHSPNSPSLDRIIPELGYTQDNCIIVSFRANTLKRDATPDELELLARNVARISRAAKVKVA